MAAGYSVGSGRWKHVVTDTLLSGIHIRFLVEAFHPRMSQCMVKFLSIYDFAPLFPRRQLEVRLSWRKCGLLCLNCI